jgi:lipid-binding SYLF domain-containing protein
MHSTTGRALVLTVAVGWLVGCATAPTSRADQEALLAEAASTLRRMRAEHPSVDLIVQHYSYALFPTVTKGGLVVGGARGRGVVYERGQHVGYCDLTQGSVGAQAGAQTFSELLVFANQGALDRFKAGQVTFAADASAVVLKTGVTTHTSFIDGVAVVVSPVGGVMLEAAIGGQQFTYQPK